LNSKPNFLNLIIKTLNSNPANLSTLIAAFLSGLFFLFFAKTEVKIQQNEIKCIVFRFFYISANDHFKDLMFLKNPDNRWLFQRGAIMPESQTIKKRPLL